MRPIISFGWTAAALLAGRKAVTRRDWTSYHASQFKAGMRVLAYDRRPEYGGKAIAVIELTQDPRREPDSMAPDSDYEAEGFAYYEEHPEELTPAARKQARVTITRKAFSDWRSQGGYSWVIRFRLVRIIDDVRATAPKQPPLPLGDTAAASSSSQRPQVPYLRRIK